MAAKSSSEPTVLKALQQQLPPPCPSHFPLPLPPHVLGNSCHHPKLGGRSVDPPVQGC